MNLKFIKPDYRNETMKNLDYSIFKEYAKNYNNKIVFTGGFGYISNKPKVNQQSNKSLIDQHEHQYQMRMIIKRFKETFRGRSNKSSTNSSSNSSIICNQSLNVHKSIIMATQIPFIQSTVTQKEKSLSELNIHSKPKTKRNKRQLRITTSKENTNQEINASNQNKNKRRKMSNSMCISQKALNLRHKSSNQVHFQQRFKGYFIESRREEHGYDKNVMLAQLKRECNFYNSDKEADSFEKKKCTVFKLKAISSSRLLPKHSVHRLEIFARKLRNVL